MGKSVRFNAFHTINFPVRIEGVNSPSRFSFFHSIFFQFFVSLVYSVVCSLPVHAQTPSAKPLDQLALAEDLQDDMLLMQEEVVETAIRQEQPISKAPANMYVITAKEIRRSGALFLPTLLRRVPGMEVMQMTGGEYNVSVRGNNQLRANRMLVMVDGRSIFFDGQGGLGWSQLPVTLAEIKKIEVLKGPASALYGFNAFDGVVNLLTYSPKERKGTSLNVGAGEFGTLTASGIQANTIKNFSYRLSVGHNQTAQWEDRDALALRTWQTNGVLDYALEHGGKFRLEGGFNEKNRDDAASADILRVDSSTKIGYARMGYEQENFFARVFWSHWDVNFDTFSLIRFLQVGDKDGRADDIELNSDTLNFLTQYTLAIGPTHQLTTGLNYRHTLVTGDQFSGRNQEDRFGLYVQEVWEPTKMFGITAGLRLDLHNLINPTYSPRIAVFFHPHSNHTFRLSGSVAYRPPTLVENAIIAETSFVGLGPIPPNISRGSDGLKPERIVSYEFDYQGWLFQHRLRPRFSLFFNHIKNYIVSDALSPTSTTFTNQGSADIFGGEVGLDFLITTWLMGYGNAAYQHIEQNLTGGLRREGPTWKVNGGIRLESPTGFNGEIAVHYVGSTAYPVSPEFSTFAAFDPSISVPASNIGSYTLLNIRAGYRFWKNRGEIAFSIFNALNDRHREHPVGEIIKSRVMGWLILHYN